jgi:hypothetical protein
VVPLKNLDIFEKPEKNERVIREEKKDSIIFGVG